MRLTRRLLYVCPETLLKVLDSHHLTHARFATHLRVSRSYWSQLLNGRRPVSPEVRLRMLESRYLKGIPEDLLWSDKNPTEEAGCA